MKDTSNKKVIMDPSFAELDSESIDKDLDYLKSAQQLIEEAKLRQTELDGLFWNISLFLLCFDSFNL